MTFQRHIFSAVKQSLTEYPITLITGVRQVGRTTLVHVIEKENRYKHLSFDDSELLASAKANSKNTLKDILHQSFLMRFKRRKNNFQKSKLL